MNRERPKEGTAETPREAVLGSAFQENAAKIYSFIYAKVGNREAAEDLTSQVFLKAVRWLAGDRSADSIRAWLYATARSTVIDYWHEQSGRQTVPLETLEPYLFRGSDGAEEVRRTRARGAAPALLARLQRDRDRQGAWSHAGQRAHRPDACLAARGSTAGSRECRAGMDREPTPAERRVWP